MDMCAAFCMRKSIQDPVTFHPDATVIGTL